MATRNRIENENAADTNIVVKPYTRYKNSSSFLFWLWMRVDVCLPDYNICVYVCECVCVRAQKKVKFV